MSFPPLPESLSIAGTGGVPPMIDGAGNAPESQRHVEPDVFQGEMQALEASPNVEASGGPVEVYEVTRPEWRNADGTLNVEQLPGSMRELIELMGSEKLDQNALLAIQIRVHEISFQLETASKAIEHGMQGTKTLLQTQA